ncbi:MAG: hypothetical protein LBQ12_01225 [Deltaproteobacteria bacterium]|nr:hypothetical protein [Deltaproteobacteria bacterium]
METNINSVALRLVEVSIEDNEKRLWCNQSAFSVPRRGAMRRLSCNGSSFPRLLFLIEPVEANIVILTISQHIIDKTIQQKKYFTNQPGNKSMGSDLVKKYPLNGKAVKIRVMRLNIGR